MSPKVGFIGLGRMGKNMVLHLLDHGVDVVGYNRTKETTEEFEKEVKSLPPTPGAFIPSLSLSSLISLLSSPRILWLMVPNGPPVDEVITQLLEAGISQGDTIIDGGNCYYKDSVRRAKELAEKGIHFIDCGTSGGMEGARNGACLMIGGEKEVVESLNWLWDTLAVANGWGYFGPSGAGHFVKMVHNGIEYGINEALGEGFEILSKGPYDLDFPLVANVYSHGSVVRGWLTELLARALSKDPRLDSFEGKVGGGETGSWTIGAAKEFGVDAPVMNDALEARKKSQTNPTFAGKVVSALRFEYGGHKEENK